jgi:phenylalanyl-tRNA synthetase beta subunit
VSNDSPVAVAGIVGGTASAVSETTRRILVESASFDLIQIRKAQTATKLSTEASARFSRGVDPSLTALAIARFVNLLSETVEGLKPARVRDASTGVEDAREAIPLRVAESNAALGLEMTAGELQELLGRVRIQTRLDTAGEELVASVTSERLDLKAPCDLMEEVARLYGYDRLPATMPVEPTPAHPRNDRFHLRERARDTLVLAGLQEIITYSAGACGRSLPAMGHSQQMRLRQRTRSHRPMRPNRPTAIRPTQLCVFPLPHPTWIVAKSHIETLLCCRLTLIVLMVITMGLAVKLDLEKKGILAEASGVF